MKLNKEIIERFLHDQCTDEERVAVETWYHAFEKNVDGISNLPENEQFYLENEVFAKIQRKIQPFEPIEKTNRRTWYLGGIAASILLALSVSVLFFKQQKTELTTSQTSKGFIEKANETDQELTFELEDGSKITLEPKSKVNFPEHFGNENREVFLTGEAFFDISKNPQKPFLVYSDKIITKVLGTSFWIKSMEKSKAVKVEVVSGKVSVYEKTANLKIEKITNSGNGVIVTPNQKVTYFDENSNFVKGIVEKPIILTTKTVEAKPINFVFNDAPLSEILKNLQQSYGIEIVLEKDILNNCPLTANLNGLPFFTKLDLVCQALHANYEVKGTSILINGKGCE
jgi:transmembrane sensor